MTVRYRLDDLGWYQFEQLVQSILKAQFGFAIQSWGGSGDWGKDAYYKGKLNYPSQDVQNKGTFVFQIKFIENANASGAKPKAALLKAVKSEIDNILKRVKEGKWKDINFYTILTNAILSPEIRIEIEDLFKEKLSTTEIYCHDANDVCDWLDNNPQIRRAFPQILSLRDLDYLLGEVVNRHISTQSKIAIEQGREIAPVFVPTEPYKKAWEILKKYNFVVLDGPPEVGKTAIALLIVLTQITDDWELTACKEPKEFNSQYKQEAKQIFLVDDAFGRTEYDPTRGKLWEKDLPHILRLINKKHWLILTSRKHILERAYKDMDLEDKAQDFPRPAEVIVDATKLKVEEKALMLYRQAKTEKLTKLSKGIVKAYAEFIVFSPNFTPERIRSFVKERLPELSNKFSKGQIDNNILQKEISEAINNPTERMIKTYDKLPLSHKWLLASLVSIDHGEIVSTKDLETTYVCYCSSSDFFVPFSGLVDEMSEAFIKKSKIANIEYIGWIHPSYRDLVIDKISADITMSKKILEFASLEILKLAISNTGGKEGERILPLLSTNEQWDIFKRRCLQLIDETEEQYSMTTLLISLYSSYINSDDVHVKKTISTISTEIMQRLLNKWNSNNDGLSPELLKAYYQLSIVVTSFLPSPNLKPLWDSSLLAFKEGIRLWKESNFIDLLCFSEWIEVLKIININEPRFLKHVSFPDEYAELLKAFIEFSQEELDFNILSSNSNADEIYGLADQISNLSELIRTLASLLTTNFFMLGDLANDLKAKAESLKEEAIELDPPESDDSPEGFNFSEEYTDRFDIKKLFSDL